MMAEIQEIDEGTGSAVDVQDAVDSLLLNIDGYEGPIDILLELRSNRYYSFSWT